MWGGQVGAEGGSPQAPELPRPPHSPSAPPAFSAVPSGVPGPSAQGKASEAHGILDSNSRGADSILGLPMRLKKFRF